MVAAAEGLSGRGVRVRRVYLHPSERPHFVPEVREEELTARGGKIERAAAEKAADSTRFSSSTSREHSEHRQVAPLRPKKSLFMSTDCQAPKSEYTNLQIKAI